MQYYSLPSLFIISNTALQLQHTFTNIPDVEIMYKIKKYLPMEARLQIYIIALSSHTYHKLLLVSLQDTLSSRAYRCDWLRTRARSKVYCIQPVWVRQNFQNHHYPDICVPCPDFPTFIFTRYFSQLLFLHNF